MAKGKKLKPSKIFWMHATKGKLDTFMLATSEDEAIATATMLGLNVTNVIRVRIVPVTPERKRKP